MAIAPQQLGELTKEDMQAMWHPAACIFPMLGDEEIEALSADIAMHGLRESIITFEGKILDGRNRWKACISCGVEPRTEPFTGTHLDALAFVWSKNAKRRHLTSSQAAIADAKRAALSNEYASALDAIRKAAPKNQHDKKRSAGTNNCTGKKDTTSLTDHKRAITAGTNRTYIKPAEKIVAERPDLAEKIEQGEMTIPQATTEMRRDEKRKQLNAKAQLFKSSFEDQPNWTLIHGDVMSGLESVRDHHGPARLIFTDPPYNIGVDYGEHHNDSMEPDLFVEWCLKWTRLCCDCLTDDGSLWLMINDEFAADFVMNARACGLHMRAWIKWYETFGVNCFNNFNRTSRHILYFVKDEDDFVFNETAVLRPSDRQTKYGDSRAQAGGKIIDDVWQIPRLVGTSKERIPDFPTQLPLELVSRIVNVATEPGDLVVDPFNGSGTTGAAACISQRKYIGIDASQEFIDLADQRLRGVS